MSSTVSDAILRRIFETRANFVLERIIHRG
jgi:hypothetical protein